MCGRFTDHLSWSEIADLYDLTQTALNLPARYNVAPTQEISVIAEHELRRMRWGLVPFWAKDLSIGAKMINARAETLAEKPAFRNALKQRRCLIPASGFFEWKRQGAGRGKDKQPFYITRADGQPMTFAGLWESWDAKEGENAGETVLSATIITCAPNKTMAEIHNRMPVILEKDAFSAWLDEADRAQLAPCADDLLEMWPVRKEVGNVRNDDPANIEPLRDLFS